MSDEMKIQFEVRSALIMKDTLTEMGIDFVENHENILDVKRPYHHMIINCDTGEVSLDQENKSEMDNICQRYQVNWYKDRAIREGNHVREEVTASGEIVLHVTR